MLVTHISMKGIFGIDGPVIRFLTLIGDLILINLLFIICSLPVITLGASATAMYTLTMRNIRKEEETSTVKSFFAAFKKNFKRSTVIWGIFLVVGFALVLNFWLMTLNLNTYPFILRVLVYLLTVIYAVDFTWIIPLRARFENNVIGTVRNSLVMAITYPFVTILATAVTILPVVLFYCQTAFFMKTAIFWLFIGFALAAYINSYLFVRVFGQHEQNN